MSEIPQADELDPLPLIDPVGKLVLITNAKCGGSGLKAQFFRMLDLPTAPWQALALARATSPDFARRFHFGGGRQRYRALQDGEAVGSFAGFYARHVSRPLLEAARGPAFRKIAVVRDPYARCVSAWLEKFCTENRHKPWTAEVVAAAGRNGTITFRQFVSYLDSTENATVNRHWRRQTFVIDFFGPEVELVRLEHLAQDLAALAPPLGPEMAPAPTFQNANPFHADAGWIAAGTAAPDLTNIQMIDARAAGRPTPGATELLTTEIRDVLARTYARDFDRLPYEPGR